jgi:hypothetical protein
MLAFLYEKNEMETKAIQGDKGSGGGKEGVTTITEGGHTGTVTVLPDGRRRVTF